MREYYRRPPGSSRKRENFFNEKDNILKLIENGCTLTYIAKVYHMHRNTVKKYLNEVKMNL